MRSTGFETRILDTVAEVLDAARAHSLAAIVLDVALAGPIPGTSSTSCAGWLRSCR